MDLDICCIGHITLDKIVTPKSEVYMPGGTTFYFSHGINHLLNSTKANYKPSFKLIASLAETEMKSVDDIRKMGIDVDVIPSKKTVYFENIYGENQNNRKQRVRAKADPFTIEALKDVKAKYIVLGSLLADDFSLDVIKYLSERGTLVVDAQGYLREVRDEKVYPCDWENKLEALKYVDILKVNEYEIEVLTGIKDLHQAALKLHEWGVKEVLLTLGSYGSIVYANETFYDIPAYEPINIVDATGCGDTYVMGYVFKRSQGASIEEAGKFASAVSTIKIEHSGPFHGTEEDAYNRIPEELRIKK
ncbi:MAG: ribokinase [Bacteroidaceae bacterium]|nr:ribokinase [Bacteroidaceae bacterium]